MHSHSKNSVWFSFGLEIKTSELFKGSDIDLDLGPVDWCHSSAELVPACNCICTSWYPPHRQSWRTAMTRWFWPFLMWLVQFSLLSASPRRHLRLLAGSPPSRPVGSSDWQRCPATPSLPGGCCTLKGGYFLTRHAAYFWELRVRVNLTLYCQRRVLDINAVPAAPDFTTVQPLIGFLQLGQRKRMHSVSIRPQLHSSSIREGERFRPGKNNRFDTGDILNPSDSVAGVSFHPRITAKKCLSV